MRPGLLRRGTIYAFDQGFRTIGTPTELPDLGAFDALYQFPDCSSCAAVSDAAPGSGDYDGGRWRVVKCVRHHDAAHERR